jgi:hypothetical protein
VSTWLKYVVTFLVGWLFGAGILTIQMVADSLQAIADAFTHGH